MSSRKLRPIGCVPERRLKHHAEAPPDGGVIVFAEGRSGTTTFTKALEASLGWPFCRGKKEGFKSGGLSKRGAIMTRVG